jgi:hypothetical protein
VGSIGTTAGLSGQDCTYHDAGHFFTDANSADYCAAVSELTWKRAIDFLERLLNPLQRLSTQRLADAKKISLTVLEPRALLTYAFAGIISRDFGDSICGLETRQIVFFKNNATSPQR